jgi:hypothetical protein
LQADRSGNVIAVWVDSRVSIGTLVAARMDARTETWSEPVRLETSDDATGALMALSPRGEAYLAWSAHVAGASDQARIVSFDPVERKWSAIADIPGTPDVVSLAADPAGNLIVISTPEAGVFATRFDAAAATWAAPVRLDVPGPSWYKANDRTVATDAKGNFIAAWSQQQFDGDRALFVARYSKGGWSTPRRLDGKIVGGTSRAISLSVDPAGNAALAWCHNYFVGGVRPVAMVSTYQPGADAWTPAVRVDQTPDGSGGAISAKAVIDPAGIATATWIQFEGVFASRFSPLSQAWSAPQRINKRIVSDPVAVVDAAGNVTVALAETDSMTVLQYLVRDGQWHASDIGQTVDSAAVYVDPPVMAIDGGGTITAAWFAWHRAADVSRYPVLVNRFR